jgi:hypothetical protein
MAKRDKSSFGQISIPAAPRESANPKTEWPVWGAALLNLSIVDAERAYNYLSSQGRLPSSMTMAEYQNIHNQVLEAGKNGQA